MRYPDAVARLSPDERMRSFVQAGKSFGAMPGRAFVRALLPVRLTDGHEFRFGVWLEVSEAAGAQVWDCWTTSGYTHLVVEGHLANAVPPWGDVLLGAPCRATVRNDDELPFIDASPFAPLARVLSEPWQREECEALVERVWH